MGTNCIHPYRRVLSGTFGKAELIGPSRILVPHTEIVSVDSRTCMVPPETDSECSRESGS